MLIKGEIVLLRLLMILDKLGIIDYWSMRKTLGYKSRVSYVERLAAVDLGKR